MGNEGRIAADFLVRSRKAARSGEKLLCVYDAYVAWYGSDAAGRCAAVLGMSPEAFRRILDAAREDAEEPASPSPVDVEALQTHLSRVVFPSA